VNHLIRALTPEHLGDVIRLRAEVVFLLRFSDVEIEMLYRTFSEDMCSSSWLPVNGRTVAEFKQWLEE